MISCERAWELLSQQLDEPLSPQEKQELEEHLAACPACRRDQEELEQLDQALRNLEDIQAPADFTQRVMAQVQQEAQRKPKVIPLRRRPQVRALAGLAACALLCIGIYRTLPQDNDLSAGMIPSGQGEVSSQWSASSEGSQGEQVAPYGVEPAQAPDDADPDPAAVPQPRSTDPAPESGQSSGKSAQPEQTVPDSPGSSAQSGDGSAQGDAMAPQVTTTSVQTELVAASLSDQALALLPAQEEWSTDSQGNTSCVVTRQVLEQLCQLLDQEGTEYTVSPAPWSDTCVVRLG